MNRLPSLYLLLALSLALPAAAIAQQPTIVSGLITATQWTAANSPYIVVGNALIPVGSTLQVQDDVEIRFAANTELVVAGGLEINGTANGGVVLRADAANTRWRGIRTQYNGLCQIAFARISAADTAFSFHSAAGFASHNIQDCHIWDCNVGIYTENIIGVVGSTIVRNSVGVMLAGNAGISVIQDNRLCNYPQNMVNMTSAYQCDLSHNCFCTTDPAIAMASTIGNVSLSQMDSLCMSAQIYPGDANFDHVVDMRDLLPIGMKYGVAGPARQFLGNSSGSLPSAQMAATWADVMPSGVNVANADCDGNGIVDSADVQLIRQNYGKLAPLNNGVPATGTALSFSLPTTPILSGDTVRIPIMLGTTDSLIQNLYGIAFSVSYDTAMTHVPTDTTQPPVWAEVATSSWAGIRDIDLIALEHSLPTKGRVDVAFTRIDKITRTGQGKVADIIVVLADDLAKQSMQRDFNVYFTNITAITNTQQAVALGGSKATVTVQTGASSAEAFEQSIRVDNRMEEAGLLEVRATRGLVRLSGLRLTDITGREIAASLANGISAQLCVPPLAEGVYYLSIQTDAGTFTRRVMR